MSLPAGPRRPHLRPARRRAHGTDPGLHARVDRPAGRAIPGSPCSSCSPSSARTCSTGSTRSRTRPACGCCACCRCRRTRRASATGLVAFDPGQATGEPPAVSRGRRCPPARAVQGRQRCHGAADHRHRGRQGGRQAPTDPICSMSTAACSTRPASTRPPRNHTRRWCWPRIRAHRVSSRSTWAPRSTAACGSRCIGAAGRPGRGDLALRRVQRARPDPRWSSGSARTPNTRPSTRSIRATASPRRRRASGSPPR